MVTFASTHHGYGNMWRSFDYGRPHFTRDQVIAALDQIIDGAIAHKAVYQQIEQATGVPWWWIIPVHERESSLNFTTHLHNGDPLTGYTHHVPAGRPQVGHGPPFTFAESTADALKMRGLQNIKTWTVERALFEWEAYNGEIYFSRDINSPYVWSWSNRYQGGKVLVDHGPIVNIYDPQCGCAVLLKRMVERKLITVSTEQETPTVTTQLPATLFPKGLDLAAIEHTFEAINPFLPILNGFFPAASPIVLFLETLLKTGASIQQGQNITAVLPNALRALASQIEAMAGAPAPVVAAGQIASAPGVNQNAIG